MLRKINGVLIVFVFLQACATPFSQYYNDNTGGADLSKLPTVVFPTTEPQTFQGIDLEQDLLKMLENNYLPVGYSLFNAADVNKKDAIRQAKKVNAAVVILHSKYSGTLSGYRPFTRPDRKTSSTTFLGSAHGSSNFTSFFGTADTTTHGTTTTYIPQNINRFNYLVTYWIQMKRPIFGTQIGDLSAEVKQQIASNKGVLVLAVIKGSPAFEADILKGDVIQKIRDFSVYDEGTFQAALDEYQGSRVDVFINRANITIKKLSNWTQNQC